MKLVLLQPFYFPFIFNCLFHKETCVCDPMHSWKLSFLTGYKDEDVRRAPLDPPLCSSVSVTTVQFERSSAISPSFHTSCNYVQLLLITLGRKPLWARAAWPDRATERHHPHLTPTSSLLCPASPPLRFSHCLPVSLLYIYVFSLMHTCSNSQKEHFLFSVRACKLCRRTSQFVFRHFHLTFPPNKLDLKIRTYKWGVKLPFSLLFAVNDSPLQK